MKIQWHLCTQCSVNNDSTKIVGIYTLSQKEHSTAQTRELALDLQISPIFLQNISQWKYSSPQALLNGAYKAIVNKTVAKPHPPNL